MSKRILIVDDDPNLQRTLADILRFRGYDPTTVGTGTAALETVYADPPAVALIDLRLEDMSGLDVLRRIRASDDTIACIVLTGYASQSSAIEAVNLGAYSYVQKPPNIDQLLLTIQRAIEKRAADRALRQSQALLHATGRMAKVGGWEIDVETRRLVWTEEIYRIHGVSLDYEPTLTASLSFYPVEVRASVKSAFARLLESGDAFDLEVPFVTVTGDHLWVHLMGKPTTGEPHAAVKAAGTFQDITERKQAEEALRLSNRRLEEALAELREAQEQVIVQERMAAIGQLAAGLAHEYNNLMATIILYADMLLRGSSLGSIERDRVSAIYDQGRRAADLTQQILDFSRKAILRKREVVVNMLLHDLETRLRSMLAERIRLSIDLGEPRWRVQADPDRLRQALMNIAINARDAMPEGGDLKIWAEPLSIPRNAAPPLPELKPGEWMAFHVQDSGSGIDPEVLPHIFEPFFTTHSPQCSGLGLSQVHGIVRQHNGFVALKTEVGKGTVFSLYLPGVLLEDGPEGVGTRTEKAGDGAVGWESGGATQPAASDRFLTLVIEEHELMRGALVAALENLNYPSLAFAGTSEAISAAVEGASPLDPQQVRLILDGLGPASGFGTSAPSLQDYPDGSGSSSSAVVNKNRNSAQDVRDLKECFPQARIVMIGDRIASREIHTMLRSGGIRWLEKPVDLVKLAAVLADFDFERQG